MEADDQSSYISRNRSYLFKKGLAYLYLYGGYAFLCMYYAYSVRIAVKPISWFIISMFALGVYLLYVLINHLLIRIVIPHRILLIFDLVTLIGLLSLFITDLWLNN